MSKLIRLFRNFIRTHESSLSHLIRLFPVWTRQIQIFINNSNRIGANIYQRKWKERGEKVDENERSTEKYIRIVELASIRNSPFRLSIPNSPGVPGLESVLDCPPRGETEEQGGVERKGGRVSRSRARRILQSLGVLGYNWRGRIMECCQWAQRAMAGRAVPRLKRPEGWRGTWSGQSSLRSEGGQNVFIPFHPSLPFLSDQECLSRLEWFIPSISGDYFIYRSWEGGTPTPSGRRATLRRVSSHQHHVSLASPSSFLPPNSAKDLQGSSPPSSVDVSVPRFRSLFENYQILSNSWLGSSLCAATKGVISWIPPRREFPAACGVSYTGYIYISFHPSWPGSKHFCSGGERRDSILSVSDQFLTLLSMERRESTFFFFSFIKILRHWGRNRWMGVCLFLEGIRWKSIGRVIWSQNI